MQFAAIPDTAPGKTLAAQCEAIAAAGCQGIESLVYPHSHLEGWQTELRQAALNSGLKPVTVILGGGLDLYLPENMAWVREALPAIAEVDAAALLTPEYCAQNPLPLFPPYPLPPRAEQDQVNQALHEISQLATKLGMTIFLEPVTQFETRFWRDVETALMVCQDLDNPKVKLCLDFHNMNITEANIGSSIRRAGRWIGHVHLADNNRRLPGQGHINFKDGLTALNQVEYTGWYTFECGINGDDFQQQLHDTIRWFENLID